MPAIKTILADNESQSKVGEITAKVSSSIYRVQIGKWQRLATNMLSSELSTGDRVSVVKTDQGWRIVGRGQAASRNFISVQVDG